MNKIARSSLLAFAAFNLIAIGSVSADTLLYYRMGDDTSLTTDSSGNGNALTASATQVSIPATGDGSTFSDPIPLTGDSNDYFASFDGGQSMSVADPFDSLTSFTAEAYVNLETYDSGSTQYVMSQYKSSTDSRSWAIAVASSAGTGTAGSNELFLLLGVGSSSSIVIPLGLTVSLDVDYYFAVSFDGTTDTDDVTFYYQDLTNSGSLVVDTISSTVTSVNDVTTRFEVGSVNTGNNQWDGLIDEVRVSDTILSTSELLISVPEPSSFALMAGLLAVGCMARRARRI
jgi:hypothetical protein